MLRRAARSAKCEPPVIPSEQPNFLRLLEAMCLRKYRVHKTQGVLCMAEQAVAVS